MLTGEHFKALLHILQHTVGHNGRCQPGYRNYYCAGGDAKPLCDELVKMGLMTGPRKAGFETVGDAPYYFCTDLGIDVARMPGGWYPDQCKCMEEE